MPRPDPPIVPGAEVRRSNNYTGRFIVDYGTVRIERDAEAEPVMPGTDWRNRKGYWQTTSLATRHAPFGQSARPSTQYGPVLHRVRFVVLKWRGFDYDPSHPRMTIHWWCGTMTHLGYLLHRHQVTGRKICADCEGRAIANDEGVSGLELRKRHERTDPKAAFGEAKYLPYR